MRANRYWAVYVAPDGTKTDLGYITGTNHTTMRDEVLTRAFGEQRIDVLAVTRRGVVMTLANYPPVPGDSDYVEPVEKGPTQADREATQKFEIRSILINHCGQQLTPDRVDEIADEMFNAIHTGPCSWAFN